MTPPRSRRGLRPLLRRGFNASVGFVAVGALKFLRLIDRRAMANFAGGVTRTVGPWLPEHRIGRANLAAAFPEKSPREIEAILRGVWDNLGRVVAEFAQIDRLHALDPAQPGAEDIVYEPRTLALFQQLRDDGKPALIFTAHLANWELPATVAAAYRLNTHILYRRPNIAAIDDAIRNIRAGAMGTLVATGLDAPARLADVLTAGGHVAMLVDQHYVRGVEGRFFGRPVKTNPFIARLARHVDCPIHGVRMVRLADRNKFRVEMTEAIPPVRDGAGEIDIDGTMQAINDVIEGWVREYPDQWLWLHRRWR